MLDVDGLSLSDLKNGCIVNSVSLQPNETKILVYNFTPSKIISSIHTITTDTDAMKYKIYPNPNSIGLLNVVNGENVNEVQIYSLKGELLMSRQGKTNTYSISQLSSGIYIVSLSINKNHTVKHILLVK